MEQWYVVICGNLISKPSSCIVLMLFFGNKEVHIARHLFQAVHQLRKEEAES